MSRGRTDTAARHGRRRRRGPVGTVLRSVATVAAVGIVSTASVGAIASWQVLHHTNTAVVSFPRDLELPIPACVDDEGTTTPASSSAMLNTALGRGGERHGLARVAQTIGQLTGLQIGYAGMVTFDGVVAMADAVGGVDVCLATPIRDPDVTPGSTGPRVTRSCPGRRRPRSSGPDTASGTGATSRGSATSRRSWPRSPARRCRRTR